MNNKNKQLRLWLDLGLCRRAALAKNLGTSRQYVDTRANSCRGISDNQWDKILFAMSNVELDEAIDIHKTEQNILKSAKLCSSKDPWIAKEAKRNLDRWVIKLGRL